MDDNQKNQNIQNPVQSQSVNPVSTPVQAQDAVSVQAPFSQPVLQPQPLVQPVSGPSKEIERLRPVSDFVTHSEAPMVLDQEVQKAGVEVVSERPNLTPEHAAIGMEHSLENNMPKIEEPSIPSKEEAEKIVKQYGSKLDSLEHVDAIYFLPSIFGLAKIILKNIKKVHNKLRGR